MRMVTCGLQLTWMWSYNLSLTILSPHFAHWQIWATVRQYPSQGNSLPMIINVSSGSGIKEWSSLTCTVDQHPFNSVDIFVAEPFDFDLEYEKALIGEISADLFVRFVSLPTLIKMKKVANRPRDIDDIEHLEMLLNEEDDSGTNT